MPDIIGIADFAAPELDVHARLRCSFLRDRILNRKARDMQPFSLTGIDGCGTIKDNDI